MLETTNSSTVYKPFISFLSFILERSRRDHKESDNSTLFSFVYSPYFRSRILRERDGPYFFSTFGGNSSDWMFVIAPHML